MTDFCKPEGSLQTRRSTFLEALREQRWDDHRFYHQSRINQSLHFLSALSFLTAYALLPIHTVASAMTGWILAMCTRQLGHFFFESKDYDVVNDASHDTKEAIKIGYNLRRKLVLLGVWAVASLCVVKDPTLGGLMYLSPEPNGALENLCSVWLFIALGAVVVRTVHLFFLRDVQTGLVWATKIFTDPFHDVRIYHRSPLHVLRGDLLDPMTTWHGADVSSGRPIRS